MTLLASRINGVIYIDDLSPAFMEVSAPSAVAPFDFYCLDCLISAVPP